MEKLEKEKKFDELIQKFSWFDVHVNNLADAMMHVAMVGATYDAQGNVVVPNWKKDILIGLALARVDLQELYELRENYVTSKEVSDSEAKEQNATDVLPVVHQLSQEITDTNSHLGEVLNAICSREFIDDGATLERVRKSIAEARMLLDKLTDNSSAE